MVSTVCVDNGPMLDESCSVTTTKGKASKTRRKPKSKHLHIRVLDEQLERWNRAAALDQRSLSSWVAVVLDRAVEQEK